jgi:hypothetical protein
MGFTYWSKGLPVAPVDPAAATGEFLYWSQGLPATVLYQLPTIAGLAAGFGAALGHLLVYKAMQGVTAGVGAAQSNTPVIYVGNAAGSSTASAGLLAEKQMAGNAAGLGTALGHLRRRRGKVKTDLRGMTGHAAGLGTARAGTGIRIMTGFAAGLGTAIGITPPPGTEARMSGFAAGLGTARAGTRNILIMSGFAAGLGTALGSTTLPVLAVEDDAAVIRSRLTSGSIDRDLREREPELPDAVVDPDPFLNDAATTIYFDVGWLMADHRPDLREAVDLKLIFIKPSGQRITITPTIGDVDQTVNDREMRAFEYCWHTFGVGDMDEAGNWYAFLSYDVPFKLLYFISPLEPFEVIELSV